MICLKNRTFAVSQTTLLTKSIISIPLWFAWKIVLLQYHKQHKSFSAKSWMGCDLLEKSYFCSITNNPESVTKMIVAVVICLKNRTFAVSQTTFWLSLTTPSSCDLLEKSYFCSITNNFKQKSWPRKLLWFAWKIVLLQYHKQHQCAAAYRYNRCDLLEKSYFCSITNNVLDGNFDNRQVVICLKNRTFAVSQTTEGAFLRV